MVQVPAMQMSTLQPSYNPYYNPTQMNPIIQTNGTSVVLPNSHFDNPPSYQYSQQQQQQANDFYGDKPVF